MQDAIHMCRSIKTGRLILRTPEYTSFQKGTYRYTILDQLVDRLGY